MDDSKLLENQINAMHELQHQLASLGDKIPNYKLPIILSGALPTSYDTLKTITLSNISKLSTLNTETLIGQILHEEKQKLNLDGDTAMLAKLSRLNCWDLQRTLNPTLTLTATNSQIQCIHPNYRKST